MKWRRWTHNLSISKRYHYRWVLTVAMVWTLLDFIRFSIFAVVEERVAYPYLVVNAWLFVLRFLLIFPTSYIMGWLIVFKLKKLFRRFPLWTGMLLKTLILCSITFLLYTLLFVFTHLLIYDYTPARTMQELMAYGADHYRIFNSLGIWVLIFICTQLVIEVNEKYSPGIFKDILLGKYITPKEEVKILMFIDLKDSTSIAEQLGHQKYFLFIKDFIYYASGALLKWGANIYQYVGDEVVVSWPLTPSNSTACIQSLLEARKSLQKQSDYFRTKYGIIPDFRAGLHTGSVMVGEIGTIKKDLAMSGDAMNTTARIKGAAGEINKKYIVSKDFIDAVNLKEWQAESVGFIELKGKENALELFYLKI